MSPAQRKPEAELDVTFAADEEALEQLELLIGQRVVYAHVWEDSVAEALGGGELQDAALDMDIYLQDGVRFELYAVLCYPGLDRDPLDSVEAVGGRLSELVRSGGKLDDVAVDTEDDLVLVLATTEWELYLNTGGWALDEWEELPE